MPNSTGIDTYDLAASKDFINVKAKVTTNVTTSLNNLKTKIDDLDVGKLNTTPADLKKLGDVEDNEVVKNTTLSKRKFLIQLLY